MSFLVIFLGLLGVLFAVAFVTKRRFGVLGLGLATGAFMSGLWVGDLTPLIASTGVELVRPPLESVVSAALILLPATLLLMSGPTNKAGLSRLLGAVLFAVFAGVLLLEPLGSALIIEGIGQTIYDTLVAYRNPIITICLALALFDILGVKTPKVALKH